MNLAAGAALTSRPSLAAAVDEAATRALGRAGLRRADAAVVFATPDLLRRPGFAAAIREATGASRLVGGSAQQLLATEGVLESGSGLALLVVSGVAPEVVSVRKGPELEDRLAGLRRRLASGGGAALVLATPRGGFGGKLFASLDAAPVAVVGGGIAGRGKRAILADGEVRTDGFALLHLPGVPAVAEVASSARPVSRPMRITAARGSRILSLDGRSALDALEEVAREHQLELGKIGAWIFAGVSVDPAGRLDRDHRLVRPIVQADPIRGAITVGERVRAGQAFAFCLRDAVGARDELNDLLATAARRLGGPPAFAVYVDGPGRGRALYGDPAFDLAQLQRRFPGLPVVGFTAAFGLGPLAGRTRLHLQSAALLLVGRGLPV
jgi:small ligand-binding sensory domain FIST